MGLHIVLDKEIVEVLDRRAGPRQRSAFITEIIKQGPEDEQRWDDIESTFGALSESKHEWDINPAKWVLSQCQGDSRRVR